MTQKFLQLALQSAVPPAVSIEAYYVAIRQIQEGPPPGQKKTVRSADRPAKRRCSDGQALHARRILLSLVACLSLSVARFVNYSVNLQYPAAALTMVDASVLHEVALLPEALRILLVEDTIVNQKIVKRLLEKRGHFMTVASRRSSQRQR